MSTPPSKLATISLLIRLLLLKAIHYIKLTNLEAKIRIIIFFYIYSMVNFVGLIFGAALIFNSKIFAKFGTYKSLFTFE